MNNAPAMRDASAPPKQWLAPEVSKVSENAQPALRTANSRIAAQDD
jgi:hypothetical protein